MFGKKGWSIPAASLLFIFFGVSTANAEDHPQCSPLPAFEARMRLSLPMALTLR